MIYVSSIERSLEFYEGMLGFELIERMGDDYARLKSPASDSSIALHRSIEALCRKEGTGIRLYFETPDLDEFCRRLASKGAEIDSGPELMPWGWKHAYLRDPDGNECSIYSAGKLRLSKSQ